MHNKGCGTRMLKVNDYPFVFVTIRHFKFRFHMMKTATVFAEKSIWSINLQIISPIGQTEIPLVFQGFACFHGIASGYPVQMKQVIHMVNSTFCSLVVKNKPYLLFLFQTLESAKQAIRESP